MDSAFRRSYQAAAEALNEVLVGDGSVDSSQVGAQVWSVARLLEGNAALRRGLADPSRDGSDKAGLAQSLLEGKVGAGALHIVKTAAAQRWGRPGNLLSALERLGVESVLAHAERNGRLASVEDELFRFGRIVAGDAELQAALSDRRAQPSAKRTLVTKLLSVKTAPETVALAEQAVAGLRGRRFDHAIAAFLDQAAQRQDQISATIISAVPLSQEQELKLGAALSQQYGRRVNTNVVIDEKVVGGVRVEIGDEVIDGTVSQRLADARRRITG